MTTVVISCIKQKLPNAFTSGTHEAHAQQLISTSVQNTCQLVTCRVQQKITIILSIQQNNRITTK